MSVSSTAARRRQRSRGLKQIRADHEVDVSRLRLRRLSWAIQIGVAVALAATVLAVGGTIVARRWGYAPSAVSIAVPPAAPLPAVPPQENLPIGPEDARAINAARAFVSGPITSARPFLFAGDTQALARARDCLAAATYYEAGDDAAGERAVAQVVLNRVRHPAFPASVCAVVFQGSERATGCQFTFTCDGAMARVPPPAAWARAQGIAMAALSGSVTRAVGLATHYHTDWVVPYWAETLDKIAQIKTHIFYRWRGYWGTAGAFRRANAPAEPHVAALASLSEAHRTDPAASVDMPVADVTPPGIGDAAIPASDAGQPAASPTPARTIMITLDPAAFPGSYATLALSACKGRDQCEVLGWRNPGQRPAATPPREMPLPGLSFLYTRDTRSGAETVRWDCAATPRPQPDQCLPADPRGVAGLRLRD